MPTDNAFPFSVSFWGSNPDEGNDDCYSGGDFATLAEAEACLADIGAHFHSDCFNDARFIMLDGPGVHRIIERPGVAKERMHDDDWLHEQAMEAGMLHGVDGYNDAMGYDMPEADDIETAELWDLWENE